MGESKSWNKKQCMGARVNKTYTWLPKFDSALARPSLKKL